MASLPFESAYPIAGEVAHTKALQAASRSWIGYEEVEDVESELMLAFYVGFRHYDDRRATVRTFAARVMETRLVSLLRGRQTHRRQVDRFCESLEAIEETDEPNPGQRIPTLASPAASWNLSIDVDELLTALPQPLAETARLVAWFSPSEAARALGCSRTTVYNRLAEVRAACRDAGITPGYIAAMGGAA